MLNRFKDNSVLLVLILVSISVLVGPTFSVDWNSYDPTYSLGSEDDDWWNIYPSQNAKSGSTVNHPTWILDALKEKPVLILIHSSNCKPCLQQIANANQVLESYGSDLRYYDILTDSNEVDYQKAIEILDIYDPNGIEQKYYVPTTVFITLIKGSSGDVEVAWHSILDAMTIDELNGYVKDSIYYHKLNLAQWDA
jgi:hypothetical protein